MMTSTFVLTVGMQYASSTISISFCVVNERDARLPDLKVVPISVVVLRGTRVKSVRYTPCKQRAKRSKIMCQATNRVAVLYIYK